MNQIYFKKLNENTSSKPSRRRVPMHKQVFYFLGGVSGLVV